jgi:serine/threonine protein kinase
LEALVGIGGMGRVYKARHLQLDRIVAVKLIDGYPHSPESERSEVLREARAAAKLDHPNIVTVYETGETDSQAYIIMQWVEGESLDHRVARLGPRPAPEAFKVIYSIAEALHHAHEMQIVHRDVKPANILIDGKGDSKLADFGLAGMTESTVAMGTTIGSFHFMPPEQGFGAAAHPSADLYSLGATWFYALSGRPPFLGTGAEAMLKHRDEPAPDIRELRPDISRRVAAMISRLMAKDPQLRPECSRAYLKELSQLSVCCDTDASASPFQLLPPALPNILPGEKEELEKNNRGGLGNPTDIELETSDEWKRHTFTPPPPVPSPVGEAAVFQFLFITPMLIALIWSWRQAIILDWLAASFFLPFYSAMALKPMFAIKNKVSTLVTLNILAAFSFVVYLQRTSLVQVPRLESMIVLGVGAVLCLGEIYLAATSINHDEKKLAQTMAMVGGILFVISGISWDINAGTVWLTQLGAQLFESWGLWYDSQGCWRWLLSSLIVILIMTFRPYQMPLEKSRNKRTLNWNR